jgi:alkylresorcinol/alkylpyrone synthase
LVDPGCSPPRTRRSPPGGREIDSHAAAPTLTLLQRREHAWGRLGGRVAPRLAGLAVHDERQPATQHDVMERLGLAGDEFAQRIFARAGVHHRHLKLEDEFLTRNLQGRAEESERSLMRSATCAVDQLGLDPQSIGTVLTASLYSLECPTLAHRLVEHYRLGASTDKYHLTGIGCASAVPLFKVAIQALLADPRRDVLVVAAESMSSILTPGDAGDPRAKTIGSAIFGDGCAAALLSADRMAGGPRVLATRVHQIPDSLAAVKLTLDEHDSHLDLARDLPDIAAAELPGLVSDFLRSNHLARERIDHWMVHPGGRRILEQSRDALALSDDELAVSWRALADHGNVGTPSIFYVLHNTIAERQPEHGEYGLAVTIGPGVSVGLMLLEF